MRPRPVSPAPTRGSAPRAAMAAEVDAVKAYAEVRAPFAGTITKRFVDPGAFVAPGAPIVTIQDASRLRISVTVAPADVRALARGAQLDARVEDQRATADVEGIVPAGGGALYTVNALVENTPRRFLPGAAATLLLPQGTHAGILLPEAMLVREGDLTGVYVIGAAGAARAALAAGRARRGRLRRGALRPARGRPRRSRRAGRRGALTMGIAGRLARAFLGSKLTPLVTIASLAVGLLAILGTPREEEPQISVPMIDVIAALPGATPRETENLLVRPIEQRMWEIPGVEHIYSMAGDGMAIVTVRFKVGEDQEQSVVKVHAKLFAAMDHAPDGALPPLVKPHTIDDVPILALTLHSARYGSNELRVMAVALEDAAAHDPRRRRDLRDRRRAAAAARGARPGAAGGERRLARARWRWRCKGANARLQAGEFASGDQVYLVRVGAPLVSAADLGSVVVAARGGAPVYLRNVATVTEAFGERESYVMHAVRGAGRGERGDDRARQAPRRERHGRRGAGARARRAGEGQAPPAGRRRRGDAQLRRDGEREGERADPAPAHRDALGDRAHLGLPRLARGARRARRRAGDARAHALRVLRDGLLAQPDHARSR